MAKTSAGLLLYRERDGSLELFLVHPGGLFWVHKDEGAWSIPKGEFAAGDDPLEAARREFTEETGCSVAGEFVPLAPVRQAGGKTVYAWAVRGDCDPALLRSNTFVWKGREYPEVDRAGWFTMAEATRKILQSQMPLVRALQGLSTPRPSPGTDG